jgi:hypothetical protein
MTPGELEARISEIIPTAAFEEDNEGQILIYTGLTVGEAGELGDFDPEIGEVD